MHTQRLDSTDIDQKCYRNLFKLNDDATISVQTSVGESK